MTQLFSISNKIDNHSIHRYKIFCKFDNQQIATYWPNIKIRKIKTTLMTIHSQIFNT